MVSMSAILAKRCAIISLGFSDLAMQVLLKTLPIDGNCQVENRGLETHHDHVRYLFYCCIFTFAD